MSDKEQPNFRMAVGHNTVDKNLLLQVQMTALYGDFVNQSDCNEIINAANDYLRAGFDVPDVTLALVHPGSGLDSLVQPTVDDFIDDMLFSTRCSALRRAANLRLDSQPKRAYGFVDDACGTGLLSRFAPSAVGG
ncbi:MAG: hypothetical protein ACYCSN_13800, partial [Acidobacteriaceae bacterium]